MSSEALTGASARIVVAEDDPDIRRLVGFALRRRGHTVLEVGRGDLALDLIRRERPALAVLDRRMPGLDGLEVARLMDADPATARIPILFLSASAHAHEIAAGLRGGADAYLVKPFAPDALAEQVAKMLAADRAE
jgi:CheY-like chemotaxis protein